MSTATLPAVQSHAGVEFCCRMLDEFGFAPVDQPPSVLVAGCGAGHEAAFLQQQLDARVLAVDADIETPAEYTDWPGLEFQQASVLDLPLEDNSFDLVFYHHVIEHVDDPRQSLDELARVLRPTGWMFLGTPNRHRLLSALGAYRQRDWQTTLKSKLGENYYDWKARLTGKFHNHLGAHAGFATGELDRMLARHFSDRRWLTAEYLQFKYGSRLPVSIRLLTARPLIWFTAPSIYVICKAH